MFLPPESTSRGSLVSMYSHTHTLSHLQLQQDIVLLLVEVMRANLMFPPVSCFPVYMFEIKLNSLAKEIVRRITDTQTQFTV